MPGAPGFVSEQDQLMRRLAVLEVRESMRQYNVIADRCFSDCVVQFRTRKLDAKEELCVVRCTEKYLGLHTRSLTVFRQVQETEEREQQRKLAHSILDDDDDDDDDE